MRNSLHADTTIKFTASQKANSGDSWVDSTERTISRDADGVYGAADATAQESDTTNGWVQAATIADGSEVVALAEGWYMNERESNDAVGAEDALGALRVSRDNAMDPANNITRNLKLSQQTLTWMVRLQQQTPMISYSLLYLGLSLWMVWPSGFT